MTRSDSASGVPLGWFLADDPRTAAAIWCNGCGHKQTFPMEEVIRRLDARGLDGAKVGIRDLPKLLTRPCPACGGSDLEGRPAFSMAALGLRK